MALKTHMHDLHTLQAGLQRIIPRARLERTALPDCPVIELLLLNRDYPQG